MDKITYIVIKRITDILISGISLILLCPFLIIIGVCIKLSSPGPILFRQLRIGKDKKTFVLNKFRTMQVNAEIIGPHFTTKHDGRITHLGRVLRILKLDELPSLLNVIKGDMSLVGPRPMVPKHVQNYRAEWDIAFSVKPGVTDYATIYYRDEENHLDQDRSSEEYYYKVVLPRKMELVLEYIETKSLMVDLKIFFMTVWLITIWRLIQKCKKCLCSHR